jgi:hypothetical protein
MTTASTNTSPDQATTLALQRIAADLRAQGADVDVKAAQIVEWAASPGGRTLRAFIENVRDKQAAADTLQEVLGQIQIEGLSIEDYDLALESKARQWDAQVASDGSSGTPMLVDVVDCIDRLAYWIASRPVTSRWMRLSTKERKRHLDAIEKCSRDLAALLEHADGPPWPVAIDLFEDEHRPILRNPSTLQEYRLCVAQRLKGQQVSRLLLRLLERVTQQRHIDKRLLADAPRPNSENAGRIRLAKEIQFWFEHHCRCSRGSQLHSVVADLINVSRPGVEVDTDQVSHWLAESGT